VLLADEPTGALDSLTGLEIMAIFLRLNREHGLTIVLVTHAAEVAAYAERIVTFLDGRVVTDRRRLPNSTPAAGWCTIFQSSSRMTLRLSRRWLPFTTCCASDTDSRRGGMIPLL
jgi:ABC-type phosphate/phosphonate transport system ATPase subunit